MKIAFITPFPPYRGGISKHSENIYSQLIKKNEIKIFNFKRQYPQFIFPGKTQYLENVNNINSNRIIDTLNPLTWHRTANEIIKGNYDKVIFRFWHPFFAPAYICIIKKIKKYQKNIKIYAICDNIIPHERFIFQNFLIKSFIHLIDKIIIMSDQVEKEILSISINCNYEKLFLPILDDLKPSLTKSDACKSLKISKKKINLLFFGLIRKYKGLDIFLKAINKLDPNINSKINVIIAGECYDKKTDYNIMCNNQNIYWFNEYIPDKDINIYFSASDYVVLPYKTASQSGIIPMAYHYNIPVITSNIRSLKKNIVIDKTGFVFDNMDHKSLSLLITDIVLGKKNDDFSYIREYKKKYTTENFINKFLLAIK